MPERLGEAVLELKTDPTKLNKGLDQSKKKTKDLDKGFQSAGKSLAKFGAIAAAASLAIAGIVRIASDLVATFKVQEVAQNNLTSAITASGKEAEISADRLIDYAGALQKVTLFGDEATISSMALLQSLADINEEGLKQITPLVQDMATVLKMDLRTVGSLIGKTIGSTTNALTRYGIEIDMTGSKSEKFALLVAELENRFGGAAEAMGTTATGALVQFNNALGDLKEIGGQVIAEGIEPIVRWLTDVAIKAAASAKEIKAINEAIDEMREVGVANISGLDTLTLALGSHDDAIKQLTADISVLQELQIADLVIRNTTQAQVNADIDLKKTQLSQIRQERVLVAARIAVVKAEAIAAAAVSEQEKKDAGDALKIAEARLAFEKRFQATFAKTPEGIEAALQAEIKFWTEGVLPFLETAEREAQVLGIIAHFRSQLAEEEGGEGLVEQSKSMLQIFRELEPAIEAPKTQLELLREETEAAREAADELEDSIAGWMAPLSTFANQATMAFGTLIVEGEAGAEAFGNAMKNALAGVLEALGEMLSVQALAAWAASFVPGGQGNIPSAIAYSAAAGAAFLGAGIVRALAHGGDFMTTGPELVMVGDNPGGVEHVQVDPVSSGGRGDEIPLHIQVILSEGAIIDTVARASRNRTLVLDARSITTR